MSAKNITTEKINSSGFQSGGYAAPGSNGGGKSTPKSAIINNLKHPGETGMARIKAGSEGGKESKTNNLWKG